MTEVALAGLSSHGTLNFVGVLVGLLGLTALIWIKKLSSTALHISYGVILFVFMLFSWTLFQTQNSSISVNQAVITSADTSIRTATPSSILSPLDDDVTLTIPLYGQTFQADEILWHQAQLIDIMVDSQYTPVRRENGLGLIGYSLGWFRLKNGDKALVSLTRKDALVLPTKKGYLMLLTVEDNGAAMKAIAAMKH